jgi:hypothetical protein
MVAPGHYEEEELMSQVAPTIAVPQGIRSNRAVLLAGALTLLASVAIVLVLVIDGSSSDGQATADHSAVPSLRPGGGPEETAVAASVGTRASAGPSESSIAASITGGSTSVQQSSGPDEARTAASLSTGSTSVQQSSGPDEARTAASISGH